MAKFVYYNREPNGETQNDCVTRAISLATNLPYSTIRKKLYHTAELLECEKLCISCYKFLIEDVLKFPQVETYGMTVGEFADTHPYGIYLVRMDGHISTIWNGDVVDIWDCRDSEITHSWQIK